MLKIKDNINLHEELVVKRGFEEGTLNVLGGHPFYKNKKENLMVWKETGRLILYIEKCVIPNLLFDLITDGLVEKAEE